MKCISRPDLSFIMSWLVKACKVYKIALSPPHIKSDLNSGIYFPNIKWHDFMIGKSPRPPRARPFTGQAWRKGLANLSSRIWVGDNLKLYTASGGCLARLMVSISELVVQRRGHTFISLSISKVRVAPMSFGPSISGFSFDLYDIVIFGLSFSLSSLLSAIENDILL